MHNELFNLLRKEHLEVKQLLSRMQEVAPDERKAVLQELKMNLLPHMEGEEKAYYPLLKEKPEARLVSFEAIEEHRVAKTQLLEIEKTDFSSDLWLARCIVLSDLLEHHIEVEESEVFKLTRALISEQGASDIYNNFISQKNDFKGRLAA